MADTPVTSWNDRSSYLATRKTSRRLQFNAANPVATSQLTRTNRANTTSAIDYGGVVGGKGPSYQDQVPIKITNVLSAPMNLETEEESIEVPQENPEEFISGEGESTSSL